MTRGTIARCAGRVACHCEECSDAALRPSQRQLVPIARLSIEVNMTNDDVPYRYRRAGYTMPIVLDPDLRSSMTRFPDLPTAHRDAETLPRHTHDAAMRSTILLRCAALRGSPPASAQNTGNSPTSPLVPCHSPAATFSAPVVDERTNETLPRFQPGYRQPAAYSSSARFSGLPTAHRDAETQPRCSAPAVRSRQAPETSRQGPAPVRQPASRQPKQAAHRSWWRLQRPAHRRTPGCR